jgi:hypothetical protein
LRTNAGDPSAFLAADRAALLIIRYARTASGHEGRRQRHTGAGR